MASGLCLAVALFSTSLLITHVGAVAVNETGSNGCDLYQGRWVYDVSYPLYNSSCPFSEGLDCRKYGRPDKEYLKFRWKPQGCDLPRFDGRDLRQRWKGKKIMFVGDSLSLNMWLSLNCMLYASNPEGKTSFTKEGDLYNRTFEEDGLSLMFYHTWFLVDVVKEKIGVVLKLDSIEGGKTWLEADVLIFNTGHWWGHRGKSQPWDYIQEGSVTYKDMDRLVAMGKGLATWSQWVDLNIDPSTTKLFFQGTSPVHVHAEDWGGPSGSTCSGETQPIDGTTYPGPPVPDLAIVKQALGATAKPVELLDVTLLSQLRKDGHPSRYSNMPGFVDCSHWCVAGVPDTWNELLYASLIGASPPGPSS